MHRTPGQGYAQIYSTRKPKGALQTSRTYALSAYLSYQLPAFARYYASLPKHQHNLLEIPEELGELPQLYLA